MFRHDAPVSVSAGFVLLSAWFGHINGWGLLGEILLGAAIHEAGHALLLCGMGGRAVGLHLSVFGAEMVINSARLSYGQEVLCVLAGPLSNVICAAAAMRIGGEGAQLFAGINLVLGGFNLLPVRPLDGGRALELLLTWAWGQTAGERGAGAVGALTSLAAAGVIGRIMLLSGGSLWLLPAGVAFCMTVWRESFGKFRFL